MHTDCALCIILVLKIKKGTVKNQWSMTKIIETTILVFDDNLNYDDDCVRYPHNNILNMKAKHQAVAVVVFLWLL